MFEVLRRTFLFIWLLDDRKRSQVVNASSKLVLGSNLGLARKPGILPEVGQNFGQFFNRFRLISGRHQRVDVLQAVGVLRVCRQLLKQGPVFRAGVAGAVEPVPAAQLRPSRVPAFEVKRRSVVFANLASGFDGVKGFDEQFAAFEKPAKRVAMVLAFQEEEMLLLTYCMREGIVEISETITVLGSNPWQFFSNVAPPITVNRFALIS